MKVANEFEIVKIILFAVATALWLHWLWNRRFLYKFALSFPGFFGLPFFGLLLNLGSVKNLFPYIDEKMKNLKNYSLCVWLGIYPILATADPSMIEKILSSPDLLNKANVLYSSIYKMFDGGLISSPAIEWQKNRKAINPTFSHKILVSFFPVFHKAKNQIVAKLNAIADDGKDYELLTTIHRLSLGISVETTMGKEMKEGDQVDENIIKNFQLCLVRTTMQIILNALHMSALIKLDFKFQKSKRDIRNFVNSLIHMKLEKSEATSNNNNIINNTDTNDENLKKKEYIFIDQAIKIYQNKVFSWNDIVSEANTIVTASFETTANSVFSTLVLLAMHPDKQERLFEEICSAFPDKSFEMEYEHQKQLPYLDMVINEVLRLTPSVPLIARHVVKDTKISDNLTLPKNLQILICIFNLHRRKDIWGENADKFDPDNFLPENMAGKHPYAFIPFSKGIRNCIGWRYALFALKVLVTGLVRNFRFETDFKLEDLKFVDNIALGYLVEPTLRIYKR